MASAPDSQPMESKKKRKALAQDVESSSGKAEKKKKISDPSGETKAKVRHFHKSGSIRSDDAIKRRAEKRGISFEEMLKADMAKAKEQQKKRKAAAADIATEGPISVKKVKLSKLDKFIGANDFDRRCVQALKLLSADELEWVIRRNKNYEVDPSKGSHSLLVTAMCKQAREKFKPSAAADAEPDNVDVKRVKKSELPALVWPEQAGPERIEYNRLLRERYAQQPDALTAAELERAKVLIARDERKKGKKSSTPAIHDKHTEAPKTLSLPSKDAGDSQAQPEKPQKVGGRSEEAMRRRAEKRGISFEEQVQKDMAASGRIENTPKGHGKPISPEVFSGRGGSLSVSGRGRGAPLSGRGTRMSGRGRF